MFRRECTIFNNFTILSFGYTIEHIIYNFTVNCTYYVRFSTMSGLFSVILAILFTKQRIFKINIGQFRPKQQNRFFAELSSPSNLSGVLGQLLPHQFC